MASKGDTNESVDLAIGGIDADFVDGSDFDESTCGSAGPTPRAFAFKKHGMLPKAQYDAKVAEELVEIKPRQREQDVTTNHHHGVLDASAFDEVPPAELYDPSWSTTPLRAEAGQLGKKQPGGTAVRPSLLPTAFTLKSSADLEDDDEGESPDSLDDLADDKFEEPTSNVPVSPHSKSIYAKGKRGALSFLARKKKEQAYHLFHAAEKPEAVSEMLVILIQTHYEAEVTAKGDEIRAKVKFVCEDFMVATSIAVSVERAGDSANLAKVVLRRNKADKYRSTPASLHAFCVELVSRYVSAKPEVTTFKVITDASHGDA